MIVQTQLSQGLKYQDFTITKKKNGKLFCRIPTAYEIDEYGYKTKYFYKEIYGVDRNDIAIKRGEFIDNSIKQYDENKIAEESFITQIKEWLYEEKYGTVKGTSFDRLEGILLNQILPAISNIRHFRLKEMDYRDVKMIMRYNLEKGYSYSTLLKIYRFLNEFFNFQFNSGKVSRNPVKQIKMYKKSHVKEKHSEIQSKREIIQSKLDNNENVSSDEMALMESTLKCSDKEEIKIFDDEEIKLLKTAASSTFTNGLPRLKQAEFFIFMLNTGIRAGEALALKYSDFDYDKRTVYINKNVTASKERDINGHSTNRHLVKVGDTKTKGSTAILDINSTAVEIIKKLQAEEPEGYDGFIIHNGNKTIEPQALEKRFYNLLRLAGIPKTGLHTLRHTFASKLYELSNGDTKFVSEMLRHESVSFTAKTYIHLERKYKQNRVNTFEI